MQGSEDRKHTSGGVFVAEDNLLLAKQEGAVESITRQTRGRIAQAWVNVRGDMRVFLETSGTPGRLDPEDWSFDGSGGEAGENIKASVFDRL